jgi:anionic cell wall polymer biosynthesis LytR-Cps2A-Psr (LCP) family protein
VTVTKPVRVEVDQLQEGKKGVAYTLSPGRRHLDGHTALAYARARKQTSDYDRMRRQRCLLRALADQVDAPSLLRGFPRLVRTLKHDVQTDLPLDRVTGLIQMAGDTGVSVTTLGITPPAFTDGYQNGYPMPDVERIRAAVRRLVAGPAAQGAPSTTGPDVAAGPTTSTLEGKTRRPTATSAGQAPRQAADTCTHLDDEVDAARR